MELISHPAKVTVGPQGRLVIPAELRREMSISSGDVLLAVVEGQRLVLEKRGAVLARVKRRFSQIPPEVSLSAELLADRRAEARREEED
ncbi:MAG TPA: AbrB family transcriptional regulator [Acidobacteria bacterium]|nr:AbrB family transcriptional regulator [Acidobacteriota bacterium]